jgi:hypothetical protein
MWTCNQAWHHIKLCIKYWTLSTPVSAHSLDPQTPVCVHNINFNVSAAIKAKNAFLNRTMHTNSFVSQTTVCAHIVSAGPAKKWPSTLPWTVQCTHTVFSHTFLRPYIHVSACPVIKSRARCPGPYNAYMVCRNGAQSNVWAALGADAAWIKCWSNIVSPPLNVAIWPVLSAGLLGELARFQSGKHPILRRQGLTTLSAGMSKGWWYDGMTILRVGMS